MAHVKIFAQSRDSIFQLMKPQENLPVSLAILLVLVVIILLLITVSLVRQD
jgi:hypothetical protein